LKQEEFKALAETKRILNLERITASSVLQAGGGKFDLAF